MSADETWGAKAIVMKENIEHHIEEEEGEMFPQARQVFDRAELDDLGAADGSAQAIGGPASSASRSRPRWRAGGRHGTPAIRGTSGFAGSGATTA